MRKRETRKRKGTRFSHSKQVVTSEKEKTRRDRTEAT